MKRLIFLTMLYLSFTESFSQNVGIGITTPLAPLHIKKDNEALRIQGTSPFLSFYNNASSLKSFILNSNNDLYIGMPASNPAGIMQLALSSGPVITMLPSGNVGIGTVAPDEKLTVQTLNNSYGIFHRGEGGNILGTRMGGTSAGIGTFSNTNMRVFSNSLSRIFINASDGYVGLGGDFPVNKLQVGTMGNAGSKYTGNDLAIGDGTNAMRILQSNNATVIATNNTNMVLWPKEATGNVGINTINQPTNKLQIGETGFQGNDLAIGNGTAAMAIYQSNTSTLIGSTTDIILKPRNNGQGRVGINTNTPRAPLDVSYAINVNSVNSNFGYGYLTFDNANNVTGFSTSDNPVQNVSIIASGRIYAREFNAFSDARIKNITGESNATNDLQTINAIQITDYTMKDKVMYGNQQFKKVIAQEVEKIYPQVVNKHTDFIPNVYQLANTIEKNNNGYLLSFNNKHNISPSAKKLQILLSEGNGMEQYEIVSIPSENQVIIKATEIKTERVFVYGEEVDDFRTVDYEGLTTLNISATQELSKLLIKQQALIISQQKQLQNLEKRLMSVEVKTSNKMKIEKD